MDLTIRDLTEAEYAEYLIALDVRESILGERAKLLKGVAAAGTEETRTVVASGKRKLIAAEEAAHKPRRAPRKASGSKVAFQAPASND